MSRTIHRTCTLCEATCGLTFEVDQNRIVAVRPDEDDVFSHGYVCPKGMAIAEIHDDPDRLRRPVRRRADGSFEPISWEEALRLATTSLAQIRSRHGGDAIGFYYGNPVGNDHGALLLVQALTQALGTRNRFSAGSQDANPRLVVSLLLYGAGGSIPVPDIDRCDYFLCVGGNPLVSNGSVMTAPNVRARLHELQGRGGKLVVVDPRKTETARIADEHVPIRPGTDAALLLAMCYTLAARGRAAFGLLEGHTRGWHQVKERLREFSPDRVASFTGIDAATIERIALEFVEARSSVAYSRMGVCVGPHATLATYATDLLNIMAGRLGRSGGAMFPKPTFDLGSLTRKAGLDGHDRWRSRVSGRPETIGDLPSTVLAEEIETPGPGQIRAMVTLAGNPVLSAPNGRRIDAALARLEFMVAIDLYINETTRHAHVILPPAWSLTQDHVDLLFAQVAVRTIARWSPPVVEPEPGERADWQIMLELIEGLGGGPTGNRLLDGLLRLAKPLGLRWDPTLVADLILRSGPFGDGFLPWSAGLNMSKLKDAPHGIDLGPMPPGFTHRLLHADKRIDLLPPTIERAFSELRTALDQETDHSGLLLIGRRELRTNNSWMHNAPSLVSGRERCLLYVHPRDAERAGLKDGAAALLTSRVHQGRVSVRVTDEMRPGVVSLPHGWGHEASASWQRVAGAHAGVSVNDWTDDAVVEPIIGQSILNGVPVSLAPIA